MQCVIGYGCQNYLFTFIPTADIKKKNNTYPPSDTILLGKICILQYHIWSIPEVVGYGKFAVAKYMHSAAGKTCNVVPNPTSTWIGTICQVGRAADVAHTYGNHMH